MKKTESKQSFSCPHCGNLITNPRRKKNKICPTCKGEFVIVQPTSRDARGQRLVHGPNGGYIIWQTLDTEINKLYLPKEGKALIGAQRDKSWANLNQDSIVFASKNEWDSYCLCRVLMGNLVFEEKRFVHALVMYLEACYLDINGKKNHSDLIKYDIDFSEKPNKTFSFQDHFKPGELSTPLRFYLRPGIINAIKRIKKTEGLSNNDIEKHFKETAQSLKFPLPISINECWSILAKEI